MQLNLTTDYAIRIVLYLYRKDGIISPREIYETIKISEYYV